MNMHEAARYMQVTCLTRVTARAAARRFFLPLSPLGFSEEQGSELEKGDDEESPGNFSFSRRA